MFKNLLPIIADILPTFIILLPLLLIWFLTVPSGRSHSRAQKTGIILLVIYLLGVCSVVGIPSIKYIHLDFSFNLLPFLDMFNNPLTSAVLTVLNVILFIPLGILLPAIWPHFRSLRNIALTGFGFSLSIELLQMFCWRLTDVDDLLANTLGAIVGFYLWQFVFHILQKRPLNEKEQGSNQTTAQEPWLIWLACLLVTIFIYPFLPEDLRNWFLYTPFWR